jgi:hypothetical protein
VDATLAEPALTILRLAKRKYAAVRSHDGWVKSKVFGRSFRFSYAKDARGTLQVKLETK